MPSGACLRSVTASTSCATRAPNCSSISSSVDLGVLDDVVQVAGADQVLVGAGGQQERRDGDRMQHVRHLAALPQLAPVGPLREEEGGPQALGVDRHAVTLPARAPRRADSPATASDHVQSKAELKI